MLNPKTTDLVSWWGFNEASGNALDSHGTNTLTDVNTVGSAAGKIKTCRDFEELNSEYFTRALTASLTFSGNITVGFWYKPETIDGLRRVLINYSGTGGFRFRINSTTNKFEFSVHDGTAYNAVEWSAAAVAGNWYFVVGWHSVVDQKIYIQVNNGTPVSVAHTTGMAAPSAGGTYYFGQSGGASYYADGMMDEPFIYKRTTVADERDWLWNYGRGRSYYDLIWLHQVASVGLSDYGVM